MVEKKWSMLGMEDQTLLYFSEGELSSTFVVHLSALLSLPLFFPLLIFCSSALLSLVFTRILTRNLKQL